MRTRRHLPIAALPLLCALGCGTPEVAEEHVEKTLLPAEVEADLRSDDPTRRAVAAQQIEALEAGRRRSVLLTLSRDERPSARLLAVSLLGKHHAAEESVVKRLVEALASDGDADVRTGCVEALAASGQRAALDAIRGALTGDASLRVKRVAAECLDKLTGQAYGAPFVERVDEAEMAADEAAMGYDDWFGTAGETLRWDATAGRFVAEGGTP